MTHGRDERERLIEQLQYPCQVDEPKFEIEVADLKEGLDETRAGFDGLHWLLMVN